MKHGGGNVRDCISTLGELVFTDGIMDKNKYLDSLRTNLIKSASNMGIRDTIKFYQDNDSKHKSRIVQEYLLYKCPKVHPPPQSPDLNPLENLWDQLDRNIRTTPIRTITELKERLLGEWKRIPQETNSTIF